MSTIAGGSRRILRHRLRADLLGVALVWALLFLAFLLITGAIAVFGTVATSVWSQTSQLVRWFVGGMGVYLTAVYLPLYIAHGYTRREFAVQAPFFAIGYATAFAALMAVGFAIEGAIYRLTGWSQTVTTTHLYDTPTQYGLIVAEHTLVFSVWLATGALLAAAFYRRFLFGLLLVPVAVVLLGAGEAFTGADTGPATLLRLFDIQLDPSLTAAVLAAAAAFACGVAMTWALVRDLPIRSKAA